MQVLNALQLKNGAKADKNRLGTLVQPVQFLPRDEKDQDWAAWNMDWLEWQGLKQIRRNAQRLMKNYKLAKGIIDRTDYIIEEDQEYADLIETLVKEDSSALELKFYPIIPNVINTLVSEFAKRSTKTYFRTVDEYSYNEMLEQKKSEVEQVLISDATQKVRLRLEEFGIEEDSEEGQQALSPESLKSLPEIQGFYTKTYRNIGEQWATHQYSVDVERFGMDELEERGFRDMLITDREFWHYKMLEDDYDIELWNPVLVFYHKSPDTRYISQGQWVGKTEMMTVPDVIDKYGWIMTEEQVTSLENIYPIRAAGYNIPGVQNDGSFYDATRSHAWNTNMPSLGMRQFTSMWDNIQGGGDIVNWIMSEGEDYYDLGTSYLIRVTTSYWKTQRRVGHLVKIDESGFITQDVIDESYKVTDKPIYNTTLIQTKGKHNIIFGEHIDWIWINETWGGVKIGPNRPSYMGMSDSDGVTPFYLGINQNHIGRLKFQFKGDDSLYGCKLPVEGSVFSDRNTRSTALVDLMKPFQIGYNIVNNQIADILIDELGTVIVLDQNALPRHSMGEDWGKNNFAKAYVAMKNFQMLPLDTTITNTENALNFQHFQKLDLEQTNRLLSRIQLATYFKQQAYEVIGVNPQRMGTPVEQSTATGVKVAQEASYAQTETYFIQHCDWLMPRVHQMRTDLAQYYQSTKPSLRLQYITTSEDRANFKINGTDLLLRDINVFSTTKANIRAIMEQLKGLALQSASSTGSSIYDLGNIIKAESLSEIEQSLKNSEIKIETRKKEEMTNAQQMQAQAEQAAAAEKEAARLFVASENDKDRQARIVEAEIKAAGYGALKDVNENMQSDYLDALDVIQKGENYQNVMNLQSSKLDFQKQVHTDKMAIKTQELSIKQQQSENALKIARENKNKYDITKKASQKDKKKKK